MKTTHTPTKLGFTIIYADDHIILRQALSRQVNVLKGFTVIKQLDNGQQLIEALQNGLKPELILLALNMPVLDGYDVIKWLKKNHPEIKILVFTMFDNELIKNRCISNGADAFISKASDLGNFYKILKDVATGNYVSSSDKPKSLSDREYQFLQLVCTDLKYEAIAYKMKCSLRLVERIRNDFFKEFNINNRTSLALYVVKMGIVFNG